ncbi:MAG: DUF1440 domain-containing protein [Acidobacteria bacterium]|nr:DUF1440 domain-containing protein [Acidobacteriota bacterium]
MIFKKKSREENLLKGVAAGVIAGLAASFVMSQFQAWLIHLTKSDKEKKDSQKSPTNGQSKNPEGNLKTETHEDAPATEKAAVAISATVFHHPLQQEEKKSAGEAVHYAMGAASGALYGGLAELMPQVTLGLGLPFGTAVWLVADEVLVPALGLAKAPTQYPLSTHASALASHFVYGVATDVVRRAVREVL